jgi:oligopeptide/dipeptide ABC transporter ATP-binding protein
LTACPWSAPILDIRNLSVSFATPRGAVEALRDVSLTVPQDSIVGIVGESGCGKTTLISTVLRLLANNATVKSGEVLFEGNDVLGMAEDRLRELRGRRIAMVFQDPMTALNPVMSIATQMTDIQYRDRLPTAEKQIDGYPHHFSGGMRQRISIAMALLMNPALLIADEPTTALDVTLEAQIIRLLRDLKLEFKGSILFVSHNLGLIAELCDEVIVMYAGEIVEQGTVRQLFHHARHPYTRLLLECDPARIAEATRKLPTIAGSLPDLANLPAGCIFAPRCPKVYEPCRGAAPESYVVDREHEARCYLVRDG